MTWIIGIIVVTVGIVVILILSRSGPQEMDEDVKQEVADASEAELQQALHPPPKTKEEIEAENELYIEK